LLGVVIEVLPAVGEIEARHAPLGPLALQVERREVFGQPAADGAEDPIQPAVAPDARPLVGQIPDVLSPVLEFDEGQLRPVADDQLDRAGVDGAGVGLGRRSRLVDEGEFGLAIEDNQDA